MRRIGSQRGAVAVTVAILMVVLLGFTAVAVDTGALWLDRKELQNGADAAALALAQSCARGECELDENAVALEYASGNKRDGNISDPIVVSHDQDCAGAALSNSVSVAVASVREHWFAPAIGHDESEVTACATASWGGIGAARVLPLTVSSCVISQIVTLGPVPDPLEEAAGEPMTLYLFGADPAASDADAVGNVDDTGCPESELTDGNHIIPGGFGWLAVDDSECNAATSIEDGAAASGNGVAGPTSQQTGCIEALSGLTNEEFILLPIFNQASGVGNNGIYTIIGYAHIKVDAYCFRTSQNVVWRSDGATCQPNPPQDRYWQGSFITGTFYGLVGLDEQLGGTNIGSQTVQLTG